MFKWTDESAVEEIDDMKILYDEKISHLELQSHRCEDVVRSVEKKIEDLGDALAGFEKEMKEMKDLGDASITLNLPLMFRHFLPFSRGLINRLLPLLWILFATFLNRSWWGLNLRTRSFLPKLHSFDWSD